jgi:hypothetical protein
LHSWWIVGMPRAHFIRFRSGAMGFIEWRPLKAKRARRE